MLFFLQRKEVRTYLKSAVSLFFIAGCIVYAGRNIEYNWQWYRVSEYLILFKDGLITKGILVDGLIVTVKISAISLLFTIVIGSVTALLRFSKSPVLNGVVIIYVETIRNTPLLIQLFVVYFVISPVIGLSPFTSAVAALSLFEGAYASEIIRTGILRVPEDQWEASFSLGLSNFDTYRHVIIPQALRQILPMLAGQGVSLIKDSALVSTISIADLTMRGQSIVSDTYLTFEIWFTVAFCYFILTASLSTVISLWERKIGNGSSQF